jgi:hypothetical protein
MVTEADRTVHAWGRDPQGRVEVVRYDKAGKWYIEYPDSARKRQAMTLTEAVKEGIHLCIACDGTVCLDRPGGGAFDRLVRRGVPTGGRE